MSHRLYPVQYKRDSAKCYFNRVQQICTVDAFEEGTEINFINRCQSRLTLKLIFYSAEKKIVCNSSPFGRVLTD